MNFIKEWREKQGIDQDWLAFYLGVSKRTIQNWESRGCGKTTEELLKTIFQKEEQVKQLRKKLEDNQLTYNLPK